MRVWRNLVASRELGTNYVSRLFRRISNDEGLLRAGQSPPEAWQRFGNPAPACWSGELNAIDREDEEFRLVRTSRSDARWEGRTQESWRHFFVLRSKDALEIASVPLAWRTSSGVARHNVEILVKKRATADAFLTSVAIADARTLTITPWESRWSPRWRRPSWPRTWA